VISEKRSSVALKFAALAISVLLLGNLGCSTSCSDTDESAPQHIDEDSSAARTSYESAPWSGEYLLFKPQKRYRFFHGLGGVPALIQAWVGFHPRPLVDGNNVAEGVGNIVIVQCVNDRFLQVRNDTCETFYLRVYAGDPAPASTSGDGGAASEGGDCVE
jgi:hypothetical protein